MKSKGIDWKRSLGTRIKGVRELREMSGPELAALSSIEEARIASIEEGAEPQIGSTELIAVAAALRVAPRTLLNGKLAPAALIFASDLDAMSPEEQAEVKALLLAVLMAKKGAQC